MRRNTFLVLGLSMLFLALAGCQSTYYNAMEKIGFEKRDLLESRVSDVKKSHKKAQKEFESAYEEFSQLVNFDGGDLEKQYKRLKRRYDAAEEQAQDVEEKRKKVESVGKALFKEWRAEIKQYKSASLRSKSSRKLLDTQEQFEKLVAKLRATESKINPVLEPFNDRVLFLKHNLNARSVLALRDENIQIQRDIKGLIQDMQESIDQADKLIQQMGL